MLWLSSNKKGRWRVRTVAVYRRRLKKGKEAYLYSAFYRPILCISQSAQAWITQFYLQIHHACLSFVCVHQSDGENTLDNVFKILFKILWPKYMMYFLYFNNKIQNTRFTENYYIIQTSRTNESQISHIKLFDQLFSSCC